MNRYKKRGWFGESYRHYLASKGVSSGGGRTTSRRTRIIPGGTRFSPETLRRMEKDFQFTSGGRRGRTRQPTFTERVRGAGTKTGGIVQFAKGVERERERQLRQQAAGIVPGVTDRDLVPKESELAMQQRMTRQQLGLAQEPRVVRLSSDPRTEDMGLSKKEAMKVAEVYQDMDREFDEADARYANNDATVFYTGA